MLVRRLSVCGICCALVLVPSFAFGQQSNRGMGMGMGSGSQISEQQLLKMQDDLVTAETTGDLATMDRLMTDDYTHTHATGQVMGKAEFLDPYKQGKRRYDSIELSDRTVRFYGPNTAVIMGHDQFKTSGSNGNAGGSQAVFFNLWVSQQGKWQSAAWITSSVRTGPAGGAGGGAGGAGQ
jgi:hypothetical protein